MLVVIAHLHCEAPSNEIGSIWLNLNTWEPIISRHKERWHALNHEQSSLFTIPVDKLMLSKFFFLLNSNLVFLFLRHTSGLQLVVNSVFTLLKPSLDC